MSRQYTTDALINSIQMRAAIPLNQSTFTRAQVLLFATDEMSTSVIPMVRANRTQHFITSSDTTTTTSTSYDIPAGAMNRGLFNVTMVNAQSVEYALVPMDFDREIDSLAPGFQPTPNSPARYYVRGDKLYLYPSVSAGLTLRMHFELLPNRLCLSAAYTNPTETAEAGLVTGSSGGVITCAGGVPSTITTSTPICAISSTPGFGLRFSAVTPSGKAATTVTVSAANQALVAVGDWIALDGDSPIVQLPIETHPILAQCTAVKLLEALGDEGVVVAQQKRDEALNGYKSNFPVRVEQAAPKIGSRNRLADFVMQ